MIRLVLRIGLGMLLVLVLATALPVFVARSTFRERIAEFILVSSRGHLALLEGLLEPVPEEQLPEQVAQLRGAYAYPLAVLRATEPGLPGAVRGAMPLQGPVVDILPPAAPPGSFGLPSLRPYAFTSTIYAPIKQGRYLIVLGPFPEFTALDHRAIVALGGTLTLVLVVMSVVIGLPLARRLRRLEQATVVLREGNLWIRINDTGSDIIGSLCRSFDRTASELQRHIDGQRHLIQAVSHELRTPVANITLALDLIENSLPSGPIDAQVRFLQSETEHINTLIQELLDFARIDAGKVGLTMRPLPVSAMIEAIAERIRPSQTDIVLEVEEISASAVVLADDRLFRRAMENLLRNAWGYATAIVRIRFEVGDDGLIIDVEDDGPGIAEEHREQVFDAFARLDDSRSRDSGGVGLGLAITRRIVQLHGGEVSVGRSELGGARFRTVWRHAP